MRSSKLKRFLNPDGLTLIEILISLGMMSLLAIGAASLAQLSSQNSMQYRAIRLATSAQSQIDAALKNPAAWNQTIANNTSFNCAKVAGCSPANTADGFYDFVLYGPQPGEKVSFDPTDPKSRRSIFGGACPSTVPSPSPDCPLKFKTRWKPICKTYPCLNPTLEIQAKLVTEFAKNAKPLNEASYGLTTVRGINEDSVQSACLLLNGTYNSITNTCRPKYSGRSCAAMGLPYQIVSGILSNGDIQCSPSYTGSCKANEMMTGIDPSGQAICSPKIGICAAKNCVGSWSSCSAACGGGSQTYKIVSAATYGGTPCGFANGTVRTCNTAPCVLPTNCVGSWGACSKTCGGGTQIYSVVIPAANGGSACSAVDGATKVCNPQACPVPINCVGSWGACSQPCGGGTQTYSIVTPSANGGAACSTFDGASRICNPQSCTPPTNCVGSWGACSQPCGGGTRSYSILIPAAGGGTSCAFRNGDVQTCNTATCAPTPVNCAGSWGACDSSTGMQSYFITQSPANGGTACPSSPRSCAVNCVGSWSACSGGVKTYSWSQPALNGGVTCPYPDGKTDPTGCALPPVNCAGSWGACDSSTGMQSYFITQSPANGGTACPSSPRSCAVNCVGSWSACSGGVKTFTWSQAALNGGAACAYSNGQTDSTGCAPPAPTTCEDANGNQVPNGTNGVHACATGLYGPGDVTDISNSYRCINGFWQISGNWRGGCIDECGGSACGKY